MPCEARRSSPSTASDNGLCFDRGGSGEPLLVCLHGLGANARVWQPFLAQAGAKWPGRWLAPDLPGHGGSERSADYSVASYASRLAPLIRRHAAGGKVTLLGHSLGGVIALELASARHDVGPSGVFAVGIKIDWSDSEIEQMAALSQRVAKTFESKEDALVFYGRQSGLGEIQGGSALLERAVVEAGEGWRTAVDMRAYAVTRPEVGALLAAATCPAYFARGADDPMVSRSQLLRHDPRSADIAGGGHNAMVDAPENIWDWLSARR